VSTDEDICVFDPALFEESNKPLLLKNFKLTKRELEEKATVAS
jgi:hypothetical protein